MINPNISEEGRQARSEKNDPRIDAVVGFIKNRNWLAEIDDARFLASGEYNENYLISSKNRYFVFRINHGSQLNLNNQIEYEFQVLQSVHESGVTPKPHYFSLDAEGLGQGVLLMDYIGGRKFEYARDSDLAARVFARIHHWILLDPDAATFDYGAHCPQRPSIEPDRAGNIATLHLFAGGDLGKAQLPGGDRCN